MKKLILYLLLIISVWSCKKEEPAKVTTTTTSTSGMTSLEESLVGKWFWDSTQTYLGGVLQSTQLNDTTYFYHGAYGDLRSTWYTNSQVVSGPQQYDNVSGFDQMSPNPSNWCVTPAGSPGNSNSLPKLLAQFWVIQVGYIDTVTSTQLILVDWSGSIEQGNKCYFHK